MIKEFNKYIKDNKLFKKQDKILVAISGGADSIALAHLMKRSGYKCIFAHCNFNLRDKESDTDEVFCKNFAIKHNTEIYTKSFNTKDYAIKNKLSIEEAARNLRYNWFEKIRIREKCKYIVTAHHLNDNIETFFIKFTSGTGIRGLSGIKNKNKKIIRPLLFAKRSEIENYCNVNNLKFRTDKSNFDTKFTRNKFRNNIIPLFTEMNPNFENTIAKNLKILTDIHKIYNKAIKKAIKKCVQKKNNIIKINIKKLQKLEAPETYLFELIRKFGFNSADTSDIYNAINSHSGKIFYSTTHRLLKDRKHFIIKKNEKFNHGKKVIISNIKNINPTLPFVFEIIKKTPDFKINSDSKTAFIDFEKLKFPITIRTFLKGDFFYPLGMNNKKNLSDFYTDLKLNLFEKEDTLIMESKDKIFWIVDKRIDNRFKITEKTKAILKISHKTNSHIL